MAFLDSVESAASGTILPSPSRLSLIVCGFTCIQALTLGHAQPTARSAYPSVSPLRSNDFRWYRNLNLLSIAYVFRPRLRSRLTLSGRAFLRKPWIFGGRESHTALATHANILSPVRSSKTYVSPSAPTGCSSTNILIYSQASVVSFSPVYLRRDVTRLVSCYALFK